MAIKLSKSSIIRTGLISYLDAGIMKSYPKSGSLWYDLSNRGNNGSLISSPTFDTGNTGNLVFNGSNNINCGDSPLNLTTGGTVSVWAKVTDWNGSGNYWGISGKGASAGWDTNGYTIWINGGTLYGHIANRSPIDRSSVGLAFGTSGALGSTIHNYTITWNTSGLTIYLDGNYVNYGGYTYGAGDSTGQPYLIAKDQCGTFMKGNVYLNLVYNRYLSASEILHNYEAVKPRFIPSINTPLTGMKLTGYQKESEALFSRMTVQPPKTLKSLIDRTIRAYKGCGYWDLCDTIVKFNTFDAASGLLNWKGDYCNPQNVNSCNFVAGIGYQGDGVSKVINTKYTRTRSGNLMTQNSAHFYRHFYALATASQSTPVGDGGGDGTEGITLQSNSPTDYINYIRVNAASTTSGQVNIALGHDLRSRYNATILHSNVNGTPSEVSQNSTTMTNEEMYIFGLWWGSLNYYNDARLYSYSIGSFVSDAIASKVMTINNNFNTQILNIFGTELITSFTNVFYETFTSSGSGITSAINTTGWGGCKSNSINISVGDVFYCTMNFTLNSGQIPLFYLGSDAVGSSYGTTFNPSTGLCSYKIIINNAGPGYGYLANENSSASNWSATISLKKVIY